MLFRSPGGWQAAQHGKRATAHLWHGRRFPVVSRGPECAGAGHHRPALAIVGRTLRGPSVSLPNLDAIKEYLRLALGGERVERFGVLYLDVQNRAIAFEIAFNGTLTQTSVYPREIVHAAIAHGAVAVVLAHNHPSGSTHPSRADEALTQTLKAGLALIDVRVLDHVIVDGTEALSMAEQGLL